FQKRQVIRGIPHQHDRPWRPRFATFSEILRGRSEVCAVLGKQRAGATIPKKHTGDGADRSPPLAWSEPPAGTKSLALICDDPDAPRGTGGGPSRRIEIKESDMAKKSKTPSPLEGRWRITWMEMWDQDFVDEEVEGYFDFEPNGRGSFQFGYVSG